MQYLFSALLTLCALSSAWASSAQETMFSERIDPLQINNDLMTCEEIWTGSPKPLQNNRMYNFFRDQGIRLLAGLAHPMSSFEKGRYKVYSDGVILDLEYKEGNSKIILHWNGYLFSKMEIIYDNFFWPPFSVTGGIKNLAIAYIEDNTQNKGVARDFERYFNKTLFTMSGSELSLMILTISYLGY